VALGHWFGLALVAMAIAWVRGRPRPAWERWGLNGVLATVGVRSLLAEDLEGPVAKLSAHLPPLVVSWLLAGTLALACLGVLEAGSRLARPNWRWLGVGLACAAGAANALVSPEGYAGVHALVAVTAALFASEAYRGLEWPEPVSRKVPYVLGGFALLSAPAFLVRPSNAVVLQLAKQPAAILLPFLPRLGGVAGSGERRVPPGQEEWFVSRQSLEPVAPVGAPVVGEDGILLLIGIDAMRAELLADERHRALLPHLFRLRDEATWFPNARGTGSSTVVSLGSVFSGLHYSQLYWAPHPGHGSFVFPHEDERPRLPELLSAAGVHTFTADAMGELRNRFGIVRGFREEVHLTRDRNAQGQAVYKPAQQLLKPLRRALSKHRNGRFFGFVHLMDGHAPYADEGETTFDRYLRGLARADRELGRLRHFLDEKGLADRTTLVVFADHGEAFGEHNLHFHSKSLYEVMVRVPLLIRAPSLGPRVVDVPVSLIDLAPTVLHLFGLPTPGHMMGQSLVPLVRGEDVALTRPIILEGRLKRALVDERHRKIIHDPRAGTAELYDLATDPAESRNLFDPSDPESQRLLDVLDTFFEVHTHRAPGYAVPYRKW
jgi:hypothetical protein